MGRVATFNRYGGTISTQIQPVFKHSSVAVPCHCSGVRSHLVAKGQTVEISFVVVVENAVSQS